MATSADIEKLERRWLDNPTGLMFAPLAEAHRKAGNHDRALEILAAGLEQHPEYVPALIVRGRCHLDAGALDQAEAAFDVALASDPVNGIALSGIAQVYERTGREAKAIERLELLLEVDRGDTEAIEALERLRNRTPAEPASASSPPPAEAPPPEPAPAREDPAPWSAAPVDEPAPLPAEPSVASWDAAAAGEEPEPEPVPEPDQAETPFDEAPDASAPAPPPEPELEPEPEPVPEPSAQPSAWDAWATWEDDAAAAVEPAQAEASAGVEVPAAAFEESAVLATAEDAALPVDVVADPASDVPEPDPVPAAAPLPDEPAPEETATVAAADGTPESEESEPVLVITESMAELFLKQGHRDLALAVYRQLLDRAPHDAHLADAVRRLEGEIEPAAAAAPAMAGPSRAARVTGGQAVGEMLRSVLDAQPPGGRTQVLPPAVERGPAGEPTREAAQPLSLAEVFGNRPGAAPGPVAGAPDTAPEEPEDEPSYDEFFGATPGRSAASADPEAEDLRQFNDWLRGLKR